MLKINMVQVKETRLTIQAEVQVMQEYLAETDAIEKCKERMRMSAMQIRWVEFINFCM